MPSEAARAKIDSLATAFIARWSDSELAERANKDLFLTELCDLLDLPHPDPAGPATGSGSPPSTTSSKKSAPISPSPRRSS